MTPSAETVFLVGQRITPLVSPWSTTTKRELKPDEGGRSVIRLQEICWKGQEAKDFIRVRGILLTLSVEPSLNVREELASGRC